jgi:hypothetical protein
VSIETQKRRKSRYRSAATPALLTSRPPGSDPGRRIQMVDR